MLTCISGMEAASSVKVLPSERVCCLLATDPCPTPVEGKRKENLRLVGDAGLMGAEGGWSPPTPKSFIDRAASSLAIAIAQSSVFSSAAEIGFTWTTNLWINQMVVTFLCFNLCIIFYEITMPDIGRLSSVASSLITATQFLLSSLFFLRVFIQNFFQKGEKTKLTKSWRFTLDNAFTKFPSDTWQNGLNQLICFLDLNVWMDIVYENCRKWL